MLHKPLQSLATDYSSLYQYQRPHVNLETFLHKYILKVFIYFYEFKHMPVISETNCKDLEGNMGEWPCVQLFTVL